jgi:hypothetical protein
MARKKALTDEEQAAMKDRLKELRAGIVCSARCRCRAGICSTRAREAFVECNLPA